MTICDFYDTNGAWCDSCEPWQVDALLPVLQVLYGAVTVLVRCEVVDQPADDFAAWLANM